ncbi:hypothetical protein [Roseococcus sp.]|uniref:hypothetical protein n=1 Tax=Roseococcus sp. TaxID=2109646 RepID=UPI003BA9BB6D
MILPALAACLVLCLASAAGATTLPHFNPAHSCADAARRAGNRDAAPQACIASETDARHQAAVLWPQVSGSARQRCQRLSERRESYLILVGCLEREAATAR